MAGHEVHENEQSVKQEAVYPKTNTLSPSQLQRLLQTKPHVPSSPLLRSANGTALGAQKATIPEVSFPNTSGWEELSGWPCCLFHCWKVLTLCNEQPGGKKKWWR